MQTRCEVKRGNEACAPEGRSGLGAGLHAPARGPGWCQSPRSRAWSRLVPMCWLPRSRVLAPTLPVLAATLLVLAPTLPVLVPTIPRGNPCGDAPASCLPVAVRPVCRLRSLRIRTGAQRYRAKAVSMAFLKSIIPKGLCRDAEKP